MGDDAFLTGRRVLDLADEQAVLCGRILADMGADVIKVEPPGGDSNRRIGPFWHDQPHPERSLWWFAYAAGKRSVTLDLESRDGRAIFTRLAQSADFVIESFPPGYLDGLGLGYADLERINSRVVLVSVSPFGQRGPHASYQGSDLVGLAMGGLMYTQGDADRSPLAFTAPQAALHGGAEAVAGAMFAHVHRERTGRGQHVDVSVQEAVTWTLMNTTSYWDLNRVNIGRDGAVKNRPSGTTARLHWPCKDGYVTFGGTNEWAGMSRWMRDEGIDDKILDRDWESMDRFSFSQEDVDALEELAQSFLAARTAQELYDGAVKWRFMLYPIFTTADLSQYRQLQERDFFVEVEHDEIGERLTYPGPFLRTSEASPRIRGRAPLIGEHNRQVYQGELGLTLDEMRVLKANGVI